MERVSGKVAAITGGASGIGEATVRLFLEEGAKVAFADRDEDRGKRVVEELTSDGTDVLFVPAHMEIESEATGFVEKAAEHFGRLDILVNNAGIRMSRAVTRDRHRKLDHGAGGKFDGIRILRQGGYPIHA